MALQTVRLCAFGGETVVIEAIVDDASLDTSVVLDPEAGDEPDPLAQARVTAIHVRSTNSRPARVAVQGVNATIPANFDRTFSIRANRRVALAKLTGVLGG